MVFLGDLFYQFQGSGVYEYMLPFLLIFAITFAILEKTQILGTEKKNINVIVSVIISLVFITQFSLVYTLNNFLPKISLFIVVAVMALILFGIFGADTAKGFKGIGLILAGIVSIVVIYWGLSPSLGFELPYWVQDNWGVIIVLIIIIIIMALVVGGSGSKKRIDWNDVVDSFVHTRK